MSRALVVIPTFNEADNIRKLIPKVLSKAEGIEVLVVDDNSQDGTASCVRDMMSTDRRIHLLERPS
ncbi:MAG: glycosyltransferase, partial [Ignavibacteriae bacterium]|nr:glycosyltransferase [Ignavibacteriota bacterium]